MKTPDNDLGNAEDTSMLRGLIAGKCCGWPQPPTVDEALAAMRTRTPSRREVAIAETVICETTIIELKSRAPPT